MFRHLTGYQEHVDIIGNDNFMQMVEDLYASPIKNIVCRECAPGQDRAERKLVQKEQKSPNWIENPIYVRRSDR